MATQTETEQPRKKRSSTRRGFGRIRKRKAGRWQAGYTYGGGLHWAPATFPTQGTAAAWLEAELKLIDLGTWTPPAARVAKVTARKLTLAEYARTWLGHKTKLARRTRDNYEGHLDNSILPVLGDSPLAEITPEAVRAWFAGLGSEHETRNAQAYAVLNGIFNTAVSDDLIDRNPCRIRGAAQVKHAKRSVVQLDAAQLAALADAMPEDRRIAVLIAGWCGLRKGELFALRRCDVVPDGSTVRIERAVTYRNGRFEVGPCKTRESKREVSVPPHIRPAVTAHLERFVGPEPDALLFVDPATGSFDGEWRFRTQWDAARKATGLAGLHFHDLRHCAGVLAAQSGATLKELMDRLGHTSPNMSMRYQHTAQGRAAALADRLSQLANTPQMG